MIVLISVGLLVSITMTTVWGPVLLLQMETLIAQEITIV